MKGVARRTICWLLMAWAFSACSGSSSGDDAAVDLPITDAGGEADAAPPSATPVIDGQLDEWSIIDPLATDPTGDASGGFDLTRVKATSRGTVLYLSFDITKTLNAHGGAGSEGTLLIDVTMPAGRLTVDLRGRSAYPDGDTQKTLRWSEVDYVIAPTYASKQFELRLDLQRFGVKVGDSIKIDFSGSDALAAPASFTMTRPAATPGRRSADRAPGTTVRIASLNTYHDGLTDPPRQAAIGRLVKAVAADIYCFQELLTTPGPDVASTLQTIDPHGDGATWNVHKLSDLAIATRAALKPLPTQSSAQMFAAAAIDLGEKLLVVFTVRTTCCGYIGNPADLARIQQMTELAATVKKLRDGQLGGELDPWRDAPVVVIGDWNLVGSRTPLDLILDATSGPGLAHWQLHHLLGDDTYTWRSETVGEFPPGMLDLVTHSKSLKQHNGFIFDTADLDAATVSNLGLQAPDSQASDHLVLVADFEITN